jgi:hypothetical protein
MKLAGRGHSSRQLLKGFYAFFLRKSVSPINAEIDIKAIDMKIVNGSGFSEWWDKAQIR